MIAADVEGYVRLSRARGARTLAVAAIAVSGLFALAIASQAAASSLPGVSSGHRPGPDLLYAPPADAPQLTNTGVWQASPILVSGATAYRKGEFLYQDFLYDDHGARQQPDPGDPSAAGNLFSKPNGTYTYPTAPAYANNAADLVELRVKPLSDSTAFRVTLNTLKDPSLAAFSIAIGGTPGQLHPFPHGANVSAPADFFLTVHPDGSGGLTADLRDATGTLVPGSSPTASLDSTRRQIEARIPHADWNPGTSTVRLAAGVGLWNSATQSYAVPQAAADATHAGGAGSAGSPAAFFNVAFRTAEPIQAPTEGLAVATNPAWWRDRDQGTALAAGDISPFFANVDFSKLASQTNDESGVPQTGPMDRILPSHFELSQGVDFSQACITSQSDCPGQYQGQLQPYAIYVPPGGAPPAGYGLTLQLHSLSAMYNQYLGTHNQSQLGDRGPGSIVITPEARGPDEFYEDYGAADVFDVWADVARHYGLDPEWTAISGYSMGGIGTFKLAQQFPDLFARAFSTVGDEGNTELEASLRNLPILMWNNHGDELVNEADFEQTAMKLDSLGYRYELDAFQPCANPMCSPLFTNHLQLAINDEYAPAAAFLGTQKVDRDPPHVTYVRDTARDHGELGVVADHAYWLSNLALRDPNPSGPNSDPEASIDAVSHGFGVGDPPASATAFGNSSLPGGNLSQSPFPPLAFTSQAKTWGAAPSRPTADQIDLTATNVRSVDLDVARAHVDCNVALNITTDGPTTVNLPSCGRSVSAGGGSPAAPSAAQPATRCKKKGKKHRHKRRACGKKKKHRH
jgi:hypothetical protein